MSIELLLPGRRGACRAVAPAGPRTSWCWCCWEAAAAEAARAGVSSWGHCGLVLGNGVAELQRARGSYCWQPGRSSEGEGLLRPLLGHVPRRSRRDAVLLGVAGWNRRCCPVFAGCCSCSTHPRCVLGSGWGKERSGTGDREPEPLPVPLPLRTSSENRAGGDGERPVQQTNAPPGGAGVACGLDLPTRRCTSEVPSGAVWGRRKPGCWIGLPVERERGPVPWPPPGELRPLPSDAWSAGRAVLGRDLLQNSRSLSSALLRLMEATLKACYCASGTGARMPPLERRQTVCPCPSSSAGSSSHMMMPLRMSQGQ